MTALAKTRSGRAPAKEPARTANCGAPAKEPDRTANCASPATDPRRTVNCGAPASDPGRTVNCGAPASDPGRTASGRRTARSSAAPASRHSKAGHATASRLATLLVSVAALAAAVPTAGALELGVGLIPTVDLDAPRVFSQNVNARLTHEDAPIFIVADMSFRNDERYRPSHGQYYGGYYWYMREAGLGLSSERFRVRFGRFFHDDEVDSPYSLFVSSRRLPAVQADIGYRGRLFFHSTRWLQLNHNSALGYPERGAVIKSSGLRLGDWRIGYQDAVVFTGETFKTEYFANPLPSFWIQYSTISPGKPWSQTGNDNSIMGFFGDYTPSGSRDAQPIRYVYAQILADDFNSNAILNPEGYQNPSKVAWSLGGRYALGPGTLGFYHAGATKYTFEPTGYGSPGSASDTRYGYTYYPATEYPYEDETRTLDYVENYIGYKYGENNLAFLADYRTDLLGADLRGGLELVVSGPKSPANPWHEYNTWTTGGQGTRFLREDPDDLLETTASLRLGAGYPLGGWRFRLDGQVGVRWNPLELTAVPDEYNPGGADPDNRVRYFVPTAGSEPVLRLSLSARYVF